MPMRHSQIMPLTVSEPFDILTSSRLHAAMPIKVIQLEEKDIPGAIQCIQVAFAEDPYNNWIVKD